MFLYLNCSLRCEPFPDACEGCNEECETCDEVCSKRDGMDSRDEYKPNKHHMKIRVDKSDEEKKSEEETGQDDFAHTNSLP